MALVISIPALFNIGTLLFVIVFIFAIIGMATFGHVKKQGALDDIVNFETFGNSMMLLFRLSTSSGWNDILTALSVEPPDCDPHHMNLANGDCGSFASALLFLLSYVIVVFMIIVNMYIAVILENVSRTHENDFGLTKENFDSYYRKWASYVPAGKQFLSLRKLSDFVADLDKPFRIPQPNEEILAELDIAVRQGKVIHCFDLLKALVKRVLEEHGEPMEAFEDISVKMLDQFTKSFARKQSIAILGTTASHFRGKQRQERTSQVWVCDRIGDGLSWDAVWQESLGSGNIVPEKDEALPMLDHARTAVGIFCWIVKGTIQASDEKIGPFEESGPQKLVGSTESQRRNAKVNSSAKRSIECSMANGFVDSFERRFLKNRASSQTRCLAQY